MFPEVRTRILFVDDEFGPFAVPIVLADEPVASLDPKVSRDILSLLRDESKERNTSVMCSLHQFDLAREFGDRIVGMRDGRIVFDGTPEEFTDEVVERLYAGAQWEDKPARPETEQNLSMPGSFVTAPA